MPESASPWGGGSGQGGSGPRGSGPGGSGLGSAPRGGSLVWGGWCMVRGVCLSAFWDTTTPPCGQNDKQVQKYYLGHNFVAAGN